MREIGASTFSFDTVRVWIGAAPNRRRRDCATSSLVVHEKPESDPDR
jgi:hypothetical protein